MRKLLIFIVVLLGWAPPVSLAQEELLVKIPETSDHELRQLQIRYGLKLRYRTKDFAIIQIDRNALPELINAQVLDTITPRFGYYVLWLDTPEALNRLRGEGTVLQRFGQFYLVKLDTTREGSLLLFPAHHRAKLPAEVRLPAFDVPPLAPAVSTSPQQQSLIEGLLDQIDVARVVAGIQSLVDNEDLEQPGVFFRSRYSLRVRDAVQFDGLPEPDDACDNAADYIAEQFRSYGLEVEFDPFLHRRSNIGEGVLGEYTMRNVVATLPGKGPNRDRIYLMTGHYDTIASKTPRWEDDWRILPAPGASDNASGIAEMLETARILSQLDFDFTIKFIAFSGEELFLFGSRHYRDLVTERGDQISGVLNFDLLGHDADGVLDIHVLGDEQSQWLVNAFGTVAEKYNIDAVLRKKNDPSFIFSDHSPFWEIGIPAVMVSEESSFDSQEESTAYIHSQEDTMAKIIPPLVGLGTQLAVATLAELARPISDGTAEVETHDLFWEPETITLSNSNPTLGEVVSVDATVKNGGPVAVEGITVMFVSVRSDGAIEPIAEQTVNLNANQSQSLSATFTPTDWGLFTLRAVVNNDTRIFESDFGNNSIETTLTVTDVNVAINQIAVFPNPVHFNQQNSKLRFAYTLNRDADVTIAIYTPLGEKVFEQQFRAGDNGGRLGVNNALSWSGRNSNGKNVAGGIYICQIAATGENGDTQRVEAKVAVIW